MSRHADDEELKDARGTTRADRMKTIEMTPIQERRYAPDDLIDDRAKEEYRRVVKRLSDDGLAADVDESLLISYCNEMARYMRLSREIAEKEEVGADLEKGESADCTQALKNAMKLGEMFGITPSGRTKIKPGKAKKKSTGDSTEDQFEKLRTA